MKVGNQLSQSVRRRLYLLRHGEVSYFDDHGRPFRPDTVPLNDEGRRQAEAAARELASIPLDRVLASDLLRSVETATLATAGRGLPVETWPELREIRPGRLAELPTDGIERAFVGAFTDGISRDARFLGGETFGSLTDRVLACLTDLLADSSWKTLLLVAHGGVNRVLLTHALGSGLAGFAALEQDAGCINVLDVDAVGRWIVRLINYTPYNAVKIGLELTTMERLYQDYCRRTSREQ
jgi:probable phosphoglycerate mutase